MKKTFKVEVLGQGRVYCDEILGDECRQHFTFVRYTKKKEQPFIRITQSFIPCKQITIRLDKLIDGVMVVNV